MNHSDGVDRLVRVGAARLGVITGLHSETRCLGGSVPQGETQPNEIKFFCAGANTGRARDLARIALDAGCDALLSFGVAGGLAPGLDSGCLVIADEVVAPDGTRYATDETWRHDVGKKVVLEVDVRVGLVAGSSGAALTVASKHRLRDLTGAVAVDMESHAVAAVAAEANVPLLVLRAIADPCDTEIPGWLMGAIGDNGRVKPGFMIIGVMKSPGDIPSLIALGFKNRRALATLRRVALLSGRSFSLS